MCAWFQGFCRDHSGRIVLDDAEGFHAVFHIEFGLGLNRTSGRLVLVSSHSLLESFANVVGKFRSVRSVTSKEAVAGWWERMLAKI